MSEVMSKEQLMIRLENIRKVLTTTYGKYNPEERANDAFYELGQLLSNLKACGHIEEAGNCTFCGQKLTQYKLTFTALHLNILQRIFKHCVQNRVYEFKKTDIEDLTHTGYGNFYVLQRFGLIYFTSKEDENGKKRRVKDGTWGVPMKRVAQFLNGSGFISEYYLRRGKENIPSESKIRVFDVKKYEKVFEPGEHKPLFVEYNQNF